MLVCECRPCQFKMTTWIFSKQNLLCLNTAPFVHGPVHASGNVRARKEQCTYKHRKILDFSFQLKQAVLTKDRRSQLKTKTNSKVRGLNNGPCTQGACVRARLEKILDFSF